MQSKWLKIGAGVMAVAVIMGAFGAHGLEDRVTPERLVTWNTGVRYMLVHGLALCGLSLLPTTPRAVGALWTVGIVIFSGSLSALVLLDLGILGAITPIGGVAFICGWIALAPQGEKALSTTR